MKRILLAASAAMLLTASAFAQEGGAVFTNNPNELPQFLQRGAPNPADWAGQFFHSDPRTDQKPALTARREAPRDQTVN